MKRITVIIPVYNAERNIERCVNSVLPQLTKQDELLLINDGSSDNSLTILRNIEKKHKIVRVIDKKNQGVAITRNRGIKEALGQYICFIDNDDYIDSDYIETFYQAIEDSGCDLVMGGYKRVTDQKILFSINGIDTQWFQLMVVAPWAKIYRREFIVENKIEFLDYGIGEDIYFNFQIYAKTNKIQKISYNGYNWWFNEKSISNTSQKGFNEQIDMRYLLDNLLKISGKSDMYSMYYVRYVIWYLLFSGKQANRKEFMQHYHLSFGWLKQNEIPIFFPLFSSKIKGERFSNRLIVFLFVLIYHLRLGSLFASLYCKG